MNPVVSGDWLAAHLDRVRVVDVRWYLNSPAGRTGQAAYAAGHIPGAVWLDIDADLSDPATVHGGRHPLPSPGRFAAALGRAGIAAGTAVVAYDDAGGSIAARLWWLLHVLGEPVAVLDGGLAAWPGDLTTDVPAPASVERPPQPWPAARFVTADELTASERWPERRLRSKRWHERRLRSEQSHLLDARSAVRYAHGDPDIDPRPGHIPGARSAPWSDNLDAEGHFRHADALRVRYVDVLDGPVVAYCGSGITACHDLLALHLAGATDLALYPGSWSQWGADPSRPAESVE